MWRPLGFERGVEAERRAVEQFLDGFGVIAAGPHPSGDEAWWSGHVEGSTDVVAAKVDDCQAEWIRRLGV